MGGIPISEKHGINPTMGVCFYCNEESGDLGLMGRLPHDEEAPRYTYLSMEPCKKCRERRETHIHLVVVPKECPDEIEDQRRRWAETMSRRPLSQQREFIPNVERSGYTFWIDREKIPQFVHPPELAEKILRAGWTFIPEEACEALGLLKLKEKAEKECPGASEIICRDADAPAEQEGQSDVDETTG